MAEKVIVIGSGPAGLMAGITAARQECEVLVLEYLPRMGRKLLASGAGKCNFTNMLDAERMAERYAPEQRRFVKPALLAFTPEDVRNFFARYGVTHKLVDDFYCFPASEKASDILQVLLDRLAAAGGRVLCDSPVTDIKLSEGLIKGVYSREKFFAVLFAGIFQKVQPVGTAFIRSWIQAQNHRFSTIKSFRYPA